MATEEYYCLTKDPFISKRTELTVLKGKLTSQLSALIEEKEVLNLEIQNLSKTITQSKEEKILLIQSMTQSAYTHEERGSLTHSFPLPNNDEVSQHLIDGLSPNNKKSRHQSRDEDYIERRGRKPKTLRVSISLLDIQLPPGAMENMNKVRDRIRKSHKKHSIQANNTQSPWILHNTESNGIHSPAQINYCPHKMSHKTISNSQSSQIKSETPNLLFVPNLTDNQLTIQANHRGLTFYLQKGIDRNNNDTAEEGLVPISENKSPNSIINKTIPIKLEEEKDMTTQPTK